MRANTAGVMNRRKIIINGQLKESNERELRALALQPGTMPVVEARAATAANPGSRVPIWRKTRAQ